MYADHSPFEPATDSGWLDIGQIQLDLWYFDHADTALDNLMRLAQLRLQNAEAHEVTLHEAGAPYTNACPAVSASSPSVLVTVGPSAVYAFNYADTDETLRVNDMLHTVPAKSLKVVD